VGGWLPFLSRPALTCLARYPEEVVIAEGGDAADSTSTPAGEPDDDFFSSWDKPAIKKPTPPISRTATPPVVGRTPSPFLNAGANGKDLARAASPLAKTDGESKPAPSRITTSAALRKTVPAGGPRKANVLGAKKTQKLGVKKVTADIIDFDEAEKKAKEEAERIEKLGYDPDAEEEAATAKTATKSDSKIHSPTPVSPAPRGGYGSASHSREKSASELERLGMGVARLGFGQVGGGKPAAAAQKKNAGGFGSVGPIKAAVEGLSLGRGMGRRGCANTQQKTRTDLRATSLAHRRPSRRTRCSARATSTRRHKRKRNRDCRVSRVRRRSLPTPTLAVQRRMKLARSMATWNRLPRISCASLASRLGTTWRGSQRRLAACRAG